MNLRRLTLLCLLLLTLAAPALAQTGGQLWVRAYEDRNGNGARDQGESALTSGIGVNLLDAEGVVIASALLESSPNASQGLVGFQLLPPGQYTVAVTGADFEATSADTFTTTVSDAGRPPVLEFGARRVEAEVTAGVADGAVGDQNQLVAAGAGALGVLCVMGIVGFIIYTLILRRRLRSAYAMDLRTTTGSMRPVPSTGTGSFPRSGGTGEFRKP